MRQNHIWAKFPRRGKHTVTSHEILSQGQVDSAFCRDGQTAKQVDLRLVRQNLWWRSREVYLQSNKSNVTNSKPETQSRRNGDYLKPIPNPESKRLDRNRKSKFGLRQKEGGLNQSQIQNLKSRPPSFDFGGSFFGSPRASPIVFQIGP